MFGLQTNPINRMAFTAAFLIIAAIPKQALAQSSSAGDVIGQVVIGKSERGRKVGDGVAGATVTLTNRDNPRIKRTTKTKADGTYTLTKIVTGNWEITADLRGYIKGADSRVEIKTSISKSTRVKLPRRYVISLYLAGITGKVVDIAGNELSGAIVTAGNQEGLIYTTVTDQNGDYELSDLPACDYVLTASLNEVSASTNVSAREPEIRAPEIRLDAEVSGLPVPQVQSLKKDEKDETSVLQTVDPARSGSFDQRQLGSLPLGGGAYMRSFDELAFLVSGVAPPPYTPGVRGPGVGFGVGTAGQFSVNGMRARSNTFSIDGSDNNDPDVGVRRQGFVALVPQSIETVGDFTILTSLWDAELGRNVGSQVNAVSKYGARDFHGEAYGFFNDSSLNARNFFDYTGGVSGGRDPFTRTQLGAVLGGPVVRGSGTDGVPVTFFAGFEYDRVNSSTEQHFATPAPAERRFLGNETFGTLYLNSPQSFTDGVTPVGRKILSLYPEPNNPAGPYGENTLTRILPTGGSGGIVSFKLMSQISDRHLLDARYNFTDDRRILPSVNRAINSELEARTRSHNLSLILGSQLSDNLFNQARFSFGRTRLNFLERSPYIFFSERTLESVSSGGGSIMIPSETGPIGELLIEPFSPVGVGVHYFPQMRASNTFQVADTVTWMAGDHTVKFGANVRRYQLNSRLDRLYRPQIYFGGGLLGRLSNIPSDVTVPISGVQQASVGVASSVFQTITAGAPDSTLGLRFSEYQVFINDSWRVRRNFTLDYGLRYDYTSVPHSVDKRLERALTLENLPSVGGSRFDTAERLGIFDAAVAAYRRALDGRNRIHDRDRNNFGPHFGFAWAPGDRTSLRGGYGVYFDAILGAVVSQSRNVFPTEIPINVDPSFLQFDVYSLNNPALLVIRTIDDNTFTNPVNLLRQGACNQFGACNRFGGEPEDFKALIGQLFRQNPAGGLAFTLPEKRLRTPYAQHWHLTLEHELFGDYLFSAGYVGTKGTKLTRLTTPNLGANVTPLIVLDDVHYGLPVIDPTPAAQLVGSRITRRPSEELGAFQIFENSAASIYHSLQLESSKRYSYGLQYTAAYTWSHAIDEVSDLFPIAGAPVLPQDSRNLRAERASANYDIRHRFSASLIWDLDFLQESKNLTGRMFGGWQLATIFQAHTGQPFTLGVPFDANYDGNPTDRPATTAGLAFFDRHGPRRVAVEQGFNTSSFLVLEKNGVVGRNSVRGDGFVNLDLALTKNFSFSDQQRLVFRAEFFNTLNRSNFGLPVRTIGAPGFGSAIETVNPARLIQFALKYSF
ncbi:MAG: carboxypeptidase regulatory-like domain-containing protein [Acidobacteriota bacterium]|nr:MAG: carboxypeptidase regulatory-like domain-containing protein [Acidobacteriota bacterium]